MTDKEIDIDTLNADQRAAYDGIVDLFNSDGHHMAILSGPAGTGKTYLTSALYEALKPTLAAMTHKAAAVMHRATGKNVKTLAKVLKQMKYNDTNSGEVKFRSRDDVMLDTDTLFIDESSMMNEDNFDMVMQKLAGNYNILFIGDEFQLPPVNEDYSKALTWSEIPRYNLREIMRSKAGSGIQQVSINIRTAMEEKAVKIDGMKEILDKHLDIEWIKESEAFPRMVEEFKNAEDVDDVRMISFTNARVEQFNYHLKKSVTGDADKFKVGDILMTNAAFAPKFAVDVDADGKGHQVLTDRMDGVQIQNNESLRITGIREGTLMDIEVYWIDTEEHKNIPVPVDRIALDLYTKELGKKARLQSNQMDRKAYFSQMFQYLEAFADLRLNYAQTVHKSQGSTYKTCFFDLTSLNSDTEMGKKLLYTGVTRASEKLVLFR